MRDDLIGIGLSRGLSAKEILRRLSFLEKNENYLFRGESVLLKILNTKGAIVPKA